MSSLGTTSRWVAAANLVDPPSVRYRRDPLSWLRERAHAETWSKQREIIESVAKRRNTAVHSCHEVGKSWIAAATAAWWLDTHPIGQARVVTTAPTQPQVQAILWNEINGFHERAGLPGRLNLTEWYFGNYLAGLGRKPSEHNTAAFQGLHARYLLVILDEAYGIPKAIWDGASTLAANEHSCILAIGNPDGPGEFEDVCRSPDWNVIHIGYEDTPNFTGERVSVELREMLVHPRWVQERERKWGRDSALFMSKCLGQFPVGGDPYAVIRYDWLSTCKLTEFAPGEPIEAGVDVGAGGDRTVIRERRGRRAGREHEFVDADPVRTCGEINLKLAEWGITRVKVDVTGIGWAVAAALRDASSRHNPHGPCIHDAEVSGVNFGEAPSPGKEDRYLNRRGRLWWGGGARARPGVEGWDLSSVDDDVIHELTAPRYEILDRMGKIKIEPKDEVIRRLGFSPDRAEALLLAFHETAGRGELVSSLVSAQLPMDAAAALGGGSYRIDPAALERMLLESAP
jgi:hypothetical protein